MEFRDGVIKSWVLRKSVQRRVRERGGQGSYETCVRAKFEHPRSEVGDFEGTRRSWERFAMSRKGESLFG